MDKFFDKIIETWSEVVSWAWKLFNYLYDTWESFDLWWDEDLAKKKKLVDVW